MTLTTLLTAGVATMAIAAGSTYLLPRHVTVERSAIVDAAPGAILELAASNIGFQRFNPYLTADPDLRIEHFGPQSGVGSGFRFDGRDGTGTQTVTHVSDNSVSYAIDLGALGQPTQRISAVSEGNGTRVTWTVESDLGRNPIFRVFGLFMDGMMGRTFEQGLENLRHTAA